MRTIVIGDIHGHTLWQKIVSENKFDKVIFVGDYFDSNKGISPNEQKQNFKNIIKFIKSNPIKATGLIGNHDFHYLPYCNKRYAGYQPLHHLQISELLTQAIKNKHLQMAYGLNNILFTHAGVTKTWCLNSNLPINKYIIKKINMLFKYQPQYFNFTMGANRSKYGDDITQTPIWVRPSSLLEDKLDNFIQVVGHTVQQKLKCVNDVYFIDTLGTSGEYLLIEDNNFIIKKA